MQYQSLGGLALLTFLSASQAADPSSGTLTLDNPVIEYSSAATYNANVAHQTASGEPDQAPTCQSPVLECDEFLLTIDLPDDIVDFYPAALLRFRFDWVDPSGQGLEDWDFFVMTPDDEIVDTGAVGSSNPEATAILADGGVTELKLVGVPFLATGSNYNARVELELGEPALPMEDGDASAGARAAGGTAGGSLGWLGLGLILLGLGRRH